MSKYTDKPTKPPSAVWYLATRNQSGVTVKRWEQWGAGELAAVPVSLTSDLPMRLDLRNHSPTGFEWSYGGSGPAQLALGLLADALGDDAQAMQLYQAFKWKVVDGLPMEGWLLSRRDIEQIALKLLREAEARSHPIFTPAP